MNPQHSILKSLADIRMAIDAIERFLGPKRDYYAYLEDDFLRSAVERKLEIIGEAMNRILQADPDIVINSARKIVNLRNHVIHGYDKIENEAIWSVIVKHLPKLKEDIEKLLG